MQNVRAMRTAWPTKTTGKPQFIVINDESMPLLVADRSYVLLRRFSAKEERRRLTAAPLIAGSLGCPWVGLENHLNYIYRPDGTLTEEEAYGFSVVLNCSLLDTYFRIFNGNTQVSATEVRAMPFPPLEAITELGRQAIARQIGIEGVDDLVGEVLQVRIDPVSAAI